MTATLPLPAQRPCMVGILGGMGPAAGADFVRLFVEACTRRMEALGIPVRDQAYPEHWLAQVPIPDRTAALGDRTLSTFESLYRGRPVVDPVTEIEPVATAED